MMMMRRGRRIREVYLRTLAKIFYYVVAFEFVALPEKSTFSAWGFISLICCSKGNRTHRKGHELLKKSDSNDDDSSLMTWTGQVSKLLHNDKVNDQSLYD